MFGSDRFRNVLMLIKITFPFSEFFQIPVISEEQS